MNEVYKYWFNNRYRDFLQLITMMALTLGLSALSLDSFNDICPNSMWSIWYTNLLWCNIVVKDGYWIQGKGIRMGVLCSYCSYSSIIYSVSVDLTGVLEITQLAKCSIENNLLISFSFFIYFTPQSSQEENRPFTWCKEII